MKNLLFILIASMLLAATCQPQQETYFVKVNSQVDFKSVNPTLFTNISLVADFDHVYDSIYVIATRADGKQYFFDNAKKPQLELPLGAGTYNIFMHTFGDPAPIEPFMYFNGYKDNIVAAKTPSEVMLPATTAQSLVLVQKSSVDAVPSIQVNGTIGIMSISVNYYYAYVKGDMALIQYKQGGINSEMQVPLVKENIYILTAAKAKVNSSDPFLKVINI
jgi:hypothetical protein